MTGIVNSTGAKSGIIGTTVGTPPVTDLATATFPAGTITGWNHSATTPVATQGEEYGSYVEVTGSSVDYTPTTGGSHVVYEYSTVFTNDSSSTIWMFYFIHNLSSLANTNVSWYNAISNSNASLGYKTLRFIIPSWAGSRNNKLNYRMYSSGHLGRMHESHHSGAGTQDNVFCNIYRTTYTVM